MNTAYSVALTAHCEEMQQIGQEFIPFSLWLERQKCKGMYWESPKLCTLSM